MATPYPEKRSFESEMPERSHSIAASVGPDSTNIAPPRNDSFETSNPPTSNANSLRSSNPDFRASQALSSGFSSGYRIPPRGDYFRSRRVKKGEVERPWLDKKDPREKWVTILPVTGFLVGLAITGILIWDGIRSVAVHDYCEVFSEDFSSWNSEVWTKEVEVGGFG